MVIPKNNVPIFCHLVKERVGNYVPRKIILPSMEENNFHLINKGS